MAKKGPIARQKPIDQLAAEALLSKSLEGRQQIMRSMKRRYGKTPTVIALLEMRDTIGMCS
jgi:hypothetical protein